MFHLLIISLRALQLLLRLQMFAIGATPSRALLLLSLFLRRVPVAPCIFFSLRGLVLVWVELVLILLVFLALEL